MQTPAGPSPYESIANLIRTVGRRFALSEYVFSADELVPLFEKYAYTKQRGVGHAGWVVDAFLQAGTPHEVLHSVLDQLFDQPPWQGKSATTALVADIVHLCRLWLDAAMKPGTQIDFNPASVLASLTRYAGMLSHPSAQTQEMRLEIQKLEAKIRKNY